MPDETNSRISLSGSGMKLTVATGIIIDSVVVWMSGWTVVPAPALGVSTPALARSMDWRPPVTGSAESKLPVGEPTFIQMG
ncbi:MAG: hypothetical protein GIKADHBN_00615 [Phycisphaerales bacterium]|nr:hypothetical protein [Phycisphaerales bacterium]